MSSRVDWSPLTGGDPAPGNPGGWDPVISFWNQRATDFDIIRQNLSSHTGIDAEGQTFQRIEETLTQGADQATLIAEEYQRMAQAVRDWRNTLENLQHQAHQARIKAQTAQDTITELTGKINTLEEEAAADALPDPIIHVQLHGVIGGGGLYGQLEAARAEIVSAQQTVDRVREEHRQAVTACKENYQLNSLEDLYRKRGQVDSTLSRLYPGAGNYYGVRAVENPFAHRERVRDQIWEYDPHLIETAFENARENPQQYYQSVLVLISELSPEEIRQYFSTHQKDALFVLAPPQGPIAGTARMVSSWWNAELSFDEEGNYIGSGNARETAYGLMSEDQRQALMLYAPGLVGNMNGIPYSHRSIANTNLLRLVSSDENHRQGWAVPYELDLDIPENMKEAARVALDKMDELERRGLPIQVVTFELEAVDDGDAWNDVKAAVSIGNLDTVDSATYLAHGIDTNAQKSLGGHLDAAASLYDGEDKALKQWGRDGIESHATVAWLNYEALKGPSENLDVLENHHAYAGGRRFAQDLDTLNTLRGEENIRVNAVAHSYGTDVAFSAMTDMETTVDSAVFLGSAGLAREQVKDVNNGKRHLAIAPENIAYTSAYEDDVAPMGLSNTKNKIAPSSIDGVTEISSNGGYGTSGHYFQDTDGHDLYMGDDNKYEGYLDEGTSARYQTSLWTTGHRDQIGQFVTYNDRSDMRVRVISPDGRTETYYVNDRKDMSSPEDLETLKEHAAQQGIDWEEVQDGDPGSKDN